MTDELRRWTKSAACRGADRELFYPADSRAPDRKKRLARARAYCAACPVRQRCLDYAFRVDDRHAIMGGLTWQERDAAGLVGAHLASSALVGAAS